ncbi:YiiX/YebB-like N1pC/P60 family cysteine hydrolase [Pantoea agglomerans]|uniref:YiiX/YebB-like N1pC/P60 family cysteine hydrolase n=1 Tax=Enterobacter agglomerans TaxID=549 RepID=UPI0013978B1C|nr:YiiX/YebB-like N1pC/P60 family cysteine hydrolase [Pantoea agglomerans]MBD8133818.1 hypothetical protein [Pantoea agglomerans]MBD8145848.1 hypothetical protein [Pantoea agglomerans]QIA54896.1 hypothetical protein GW574_21400 [Pantoea agglomerans]WVL82655.1 YiiX/YebB-like N1pC/P60 family cysteine hydrolase [Pantoea agglomerans]WVL87867.1 YiiX/YebB-like N1pC/P60 family cysteine hydrolase [Pantoea agglomerans]
MNVMCGDVLLVTGRSFKSTALVSAQKAIYPKARSSHVELHLGDGTIMHSTGAGGVHLTFLLDELKDIKDNWSVIRLKGLSDSERDEIMKSAIYFIKQSYNKRFFRENITQSSFCSELIAKSFQKAGVKILEGKKPSNVAPAHFDKAREKSMAWEDVTHEYEGLINKIKADEWRYRFVFSTIRGALDKRSVLSHMKTEVYKAMQSIAKDSDDSKFYELVEKVKAELKENRTLNFWYEEDTVPSVHPIKK